MEWSGGETMKNVLSAHKFKEQIMNCLTGATEIEIGRDGFRKCIEKHRAGG